MGPLLCYDYDAMVRVLVERDGMSEEDAREHLDFNVVGAYVGPDTPMVLRRGTHEEVVALLDDGGEASADA